MHSGGQCRKQTSSFQVFQRGKNLGPVLMQLSGCSNQENFWIREEALFSKRPLPTPPRFPSCHCASANSCFVCPNGFSTDGSWRQLDFHPTSSCGILSVGWRTITAGTSIFHCNVSRRSNSYATLRQGCGWRATDTPSTQKTTGRVFTTRGVLLLNIEKTFTSLTGSPSTMMINIQNAFPHPNYKMANQ